MIDREHDLPITRQAAVLNVSRGSVYYRPRPMPEADLAIMRRLDRLHLEFPFAGSRMLRGLLAAEGCKVGRCHVKTLMQRMEAAFFSQGKEGIESTGITTSSRATSRNTARAQCRTLPQAGRVRSRWDWRRRSPSGGCALPPGPWGFPSTKPIS